jgi:RimJ/RimL family protein N-acetyltransferase
VIDTAALRGKPVIEGERVDLEPLGSQHATAMWRTMQDRELRRLTGSHRDFTALDIERWCASRAEQRYRLDLAVVRRTDRCYLGELALNDLDEDNESLNFRIALDPAHTGRGYGTEATMLALGQAFRVVRAHRVELQVFAFNDRAAHVYAKAGFTREGVRREALLWEGERHDAVLMAALRPDWLARFGA